MHGSPPRIVFWSDSGDDPPVGEEMEAGREHEQAGVRQQAEGADGGVDVKPGGEADGYQEGR